MKTVKCSPLVTLLIYPGDARGAVKWRKIISGQANKGLSFSAAIFDFRGTESPFGLIPYYAVDVNTYSRAPLATYDLPMTDLPLSFRSETDPSLVLFASFHPPSFPLE